MVSERVAVFIDGSNVLHMSQMFRRGWKIDYYKLVTILVGPARQLVRAYFYTSVAVPPLPAQVRFLQALKYFGFSVTTRPLRPRQKGWMEKGVDVALVTDLLGLAYRNAYDTAVLVSGDADYVGAMDEVKRLGKKVEVAAFEFGVASEMKSVADRYISLENIAESIQLAAEEKQDQ